MQNILKLYQIFKYLSVTTLPNLHRRSYRWNITQFRAIKISFASRPWLHQSPLSSYRQLISQNCDKSMEFNCLGQPGAAQPQWKKLTSIICFQLLAAVREKIHYNTRELINSLSRLRCYCLWIFSVRHIGHGINDIGLNHHNIVTSLALSFSM